jgi:hypothetical protein
MKRTALLTLLAVMAIACTEAASDTPSGSSGQSSVLASASSPSPAPSPRKVGDTEMLPDPVGDSFPATTGHMDTVAYGVSKSDDGGGRFAFVFDVADPIPASFEVPLNYDAAQYSFCLDTDGSSSPIGYPFVANEPVPCEFILTAVSEGKGWTGTLIDRRPLLDGKDAKTPTIPFFTDGSRTRGWFLVQAAALGNPEKFAWAMSASLLKLPLPSDDFIDLDANYEEMLRFQA